MEEKHASLYHLRLVLSFLMGALENRHAQGRIFAMELQEMHLQSTCKQEDSLELLALLHGRLLISFLLIFYLFFFLVKFSRICHFVGKTAVRSESDGHWTSVAES